MPRRWAMGTYSERVSSAMRRLLSGGRKSRVSMLCVRSASLTRMTRMSWAVAISIFLQFSDCSTSFGEEPGGHRGHVEMELGEDAGHFQGMGDEGVAAGAGLGPVGPEGEFEGLS